MPLLQIKAPIPHSVCFCFEDPCLNHHCKKGKVCEVDESNTPMCVCQDPTSCPIAEGEFEHVSLKIPAAAQTVNSSQTVFFCFFFFKTL